MTFKVTTSKECPPNSGASYRHYIAGNVYGSETDPPGTPFVQERAIREGWAIVWPPEEVPNIHAVDPTAPAVHLTSATDTLSGADWQFLSIPAEAIVGEEPEPVAVVVVTSETTPGTESATATLLDGSPLPEAERGSAVLKELEPLPESIHFIEPVSLATEAKQETEQPEAQLDEETLQLGQANTNSDNVDGEQE